MFSKWNECIQKIMELVTINKDLANYVLHVSMNELLTDENQLKWYIIDEYKKIKEYDMVSFMACIMVVKEKMMENMEKEHWSELFTKEILTKIVDDLDSKNITFTMEENEDKKMFKKNLNIFYRKCAPERLREKTFHLNDVVTKYYDNQEELNKKLMDIYGYNLHTMNEKITRRKLKRSIIENGLLDLPNLLS